MMVCDQSAACKTLLWVLLQIVCPQHLKELDLRQAEMCWTYQEPQILLTAGTAQLGHQENTVRFLNLDQRML